MELVGKTWKLIIPEKNFRAAKRRRNRKSHIWENFCHTEKRRGVLGFYPVILFLDRPPAPTFIFIFFNFDLIKTQNIEKLTIFWFLK